MFLQFQCSRDLRNVAKNKVSALAILVYACRHEHVAALATMTHSQHQAARKNKFSKILLDTSEQYAAEWPDPLLITDYVVFLLEISVTFSWLLRARLAR